ncbi:MAG: nucleotidyltransferase family protein [Cyanobacteria bacterium HKST-UBA04]|nr:nucleotidyltransferase family protein [Cyanobacteria bacterium HKST-UBA04]
MITLELVPDLAQQDLPCRIEPLDPEPGSAFSQCQRIIRSQDGAWLAEARQSHSPDWSVQFFQGKSDFCAIISNKRLRVLLLPGARFESPDTQVVMAPSSAPAHVPATDTTHLPLPNPKPQDSVQTVTCQAMILGAGIASRFEPFSGDTTGYSKPSVPLVGQDSVIATIAKHLQAHGMTDILINTYYRPDQLKAQLATISGLNITYVDETAPSGTAGGLGKALEQGLVDRTKPLLIIQGDAVTNADLSFLLQTHRHRHAALTIGGQIVGDEEVHRFGMIDTDRCTDDGQSGHVTGFKEKPRLADAGPTRFANTGFYILDPVVFDAFEQHYQTCRARDDGHGYYDYACDVFPMIFEKVAQGAFMDNASQQPYTFWAQALEGYWCDIGNPTQYINTLADIDAGLLHEKTPAFMTVWQSFYQNGVAWWPGSHHYADDLTQVSLTAPAVVTPIP